MMLEVDPVPVYEEPVEEPVPPHEEPVPPHEEPVSITVRIDEKISGLTPNAPEYCIFRVHTQLRKENEKAYDPQVLAIGPYNRGRNDLMRMEEHKLRYLLLFLQRRGESTVEPYIQAMREHEQSAREFYAERISLNSDEFLEMMLLDALFIIELFRKFAKKVEFEEFDPIFRSGRGMLYSVERDLLLFENQIPFFLLVKLFDQTEDPPENSLINLAMGFFQGSLSPFGGRNPESSPVSVKDIGHLLDFFHKIIFVPNPSGDIEKLESESNSIHSATELQDAGVKFKKLKSEGRIFDVKFNNGEMEIPPLKIEDRSESIFRNLIAYEQCRDPKNRRPKYFTEYVNFMDNLINYPKDVELLRRRGIINNLLGDDEVVSTMFNKLGGGVSMFNNFYADTFIDVNEYYSNKRWRRRRNVWMANFRQKYFSSPWALISLFAAVFLLLLASTQTTYSVLTFYNRK